MRESGLGERK